MGAEHHSLFQLGPDPTPYRKLTDRGVRVEEAFGREILVVEPEAIRRLAEEAMIDINHLLRPGHLAQLAKILDDPEATANDKFVAYDLMKNANIAAGGVLPMCQDTGTAIVVAKKGRRVWTDGLDEAAIAHGVREAYRKKNLRYSQVAPLSTFEEANTGDNLPAQIDIAAEGEDTYKFLFMAKGGGSANKTFLYQATPSILTHERMIAFLKEKILTLGTAACPPYHLAIVIGGLSAELNLKTVKLASARYLDALPTSGAPDGRAFRDLELEAEIHKLTQELGVGAQFGGKYFCHDVRVIRLPRHGASLPIGLGVSCSADRQALGKITREGVFLEELERDPARFLPAIDEAALEGEVVKIDLNRPMKEILAELDPASDPHAARADRADDRRPRRRPRQDPRAAGARRADAAVFRSTIRSITPAPPRRRRAWRPARSGRRRPGAWIPSSTSSRPPAARWSCSPRATARRKCARPAPGTAASISARSAAPPRASPRTASGKSRFSNIRSSAWRRCGGSRSRTSPPSSSSTTRATTSSRNSISGER